MPKLQLIVRAPSTADPGRFARRMLDDLAPRLLARDPRTLKVTLTDRRPPRVSVVPLARHPLALFSFEHDEATGWEALVPRDLTPALYRVEESVPRAYERTWPDGTATPGVGLLTLLNRRKDLDDATFLRRWHGGHTPLSLELHPLWNYVRNVVLDTLTPGAPRWDGIVEEHFRDERDLLSPARFFGGAPHRVVPSMVRVGVDIVGFLDLPSLRCYLVAEHHLVSGAR